MTRSPASQPTLPAVGESGRPRVYINGQEPKYAPGALHSLAVGAQGVGAGLRDIALTPFDMMAGLQNIITAGINKAAGTHLPFATPASSWLNEQQSRLRSLKPT